MITLIFIGLVIWFLIWLWNDSDGWFEFLFGTFMALMLGAGLCLVPLLIAHEILPIEEISRDTYTVPIYSLRNDSEVSGHFFLGSGTIKTTEYYYMFSRNNDGSFARFSVEANDAIIYQNETGQPNCNWQIINYKIKYSLLVMGFPDTRTRETLKALHVPANTIIQEYHLK